VLHVQKQGLFVRHVKVVLNFVVQLGFQEFRGIVEVDLLLCLLGTFLSPSLRFVWSIGLIT